jgi:hypothetical protein
LVAPEVAEVAEEAEMAEDLAPPLVLALMVGPAPAKERPPAMQGEV